MPTPEVALDNITDEELNRAPLDSIQNLISHNNEGDDHKTTQVSSCIITHYKKEKTSTFNKYTVYPTQKIQRKETDIRQKRYRYVRIKTRSFLTNIAYSRLNKEYCDNRAFICNLGFVSSEHESTFFGKKIPKCLRRS